MLSEIYVSLDGGTSSSSSHIPLWLLSPTPNLTYKIHANDRNNCVSRTFSCHFKNSLGERCSVWNISPGLKMISQFAVTLVLTLLLCLPVFFCCHQVFTQTAAYVLLVFSEEHCHMIWPNYHNFEEHILFYKCSVFVYVLELFITSLRSG